MRSAGMQGPFRVSQRRGTASAGDGDDLGDDGHRRLGWTCATEIEAHGRVDALQCSLGDAAGA